MNSNWLDEIVDAVCGSKYTAVIFVVAITVLCVVLYSNKLNYEEKCYEKGGYIYSTQTKTDVCSK